MGLLSFIPNVIKGIFGGGGGGGNSGGAQINPELEKERMKTDLEKMRMNAEAMQTMQQQNAAAAAEMRTTFNEAMKSAEQAASNRESALRKDREELMEAQKRRETEMQKASAEERTKLREENLAQLKAKDDEIREHREESQRERREAQDKFEAAKAEMQLVERTLRERMVEQAEATTKAMLELSEKHGIQMNELQEKRIEDVKDHTKKVETLFKQQLDIAAASAQMQIKMTIEHYKSNEHLAIVDYRNSLRTHFDYMRYGHAQSIQCLTAACEDDSSGTIGTAKGSMTILVSAISRFEMAMSSVLAAIDRAGSVPIDIKMEQQKFLEAVSKLLSAYQSRINRMLGGLSATVPKAITMTQVDEIESSFESLSTSVCSIPLLPNASNFAQLAVDVPKAIQN